MIGYKFATTFRGDKDLILTLEIPADAITNMDRPGIVVKETASYRANKVKVLSIEDTDGTPHGVAYSGLGTKKQEYYVVGRITEDPTYNMDNTLVDAAGLHFFLLRQAAENYIMRPIKGGNGVYQTWYANGQLRLEYPVVDNKPHGPYQTWFSNGQLSMYDNYVNGVKHGPCQVWYNNGQLSHERAYVDGKQHGLCRTWQPTGREIFN